MRRSRSWLAGLARLVAPVLSLLLLAPVARAQTTEDAKAHYQKATAHFAVGEYREAGSEYEEAFKLKQDPAILYNAAQSFRLAGDTPKALLLYNNIIKLYPSSPFARESKERIDKLSQAPAGTPAPTTTPTAPPPPAAAAPPPVTPIAVAPAPAAPPPAVMPPPSGAPSLVMVAPPPAEAAPSPFYKRGWFWVVVGAVAAGAVVTAVVLSSSTTPWNNLSDVHAAVAR